MFSRRQGLDLPLAAAAPRTVRSKIVRALKIAAGVFIAIIIGGVLFIKFNTEKAAEFADALRPVIGSDNVLSLERIFFNLSDKVQRLENKQPVTPQFVDGGNAATLANGSPAPSATPDGKLMLDRIPVQYGFTPLASEGIWKDTPFGAFPGRQVAAHTFMRPDADRKFAVVTLLKMDSSVMKMGSVAGKKEPAGAVGKPGPGAVPKDIVESGRLLAAFDGGFQYRDGAYGMIVGNTTYLPLKNDLATIVGHEDGSLQIINYTGQSLGSNVTFARQNCPMLIENGEIAVQNEKNKALWGRTPATAIYTWRTGIGLDKNGNLIFAVGNNLTPTTLAIALRSAGAVNAMQLDINPNWVRFNLFTSIGGGKYTTKTLTTDLKDGSDSYLNGYEKDFFYLYTK